MTENNFIKELELLNITVTPIMIKQLEDYYNILLDWNKKINLTTIIEKEQVYLKHFYDSATIVKIIELNKIETLCDVGTGAGFPGIVLKILFPHLKVTLVDSLNKRINFLNYVINELKLSDIIAIHNRAEDFAKNKKNRFDLVVARAVAPLPLLIEYCIPLVSSGKYFISMKSDISREIYEAKIILKRKNSFVDKEIIFQLPLEQSKRTLILIRKM